MRARLHPDVTTLALIVARVAIRQGESEAGRILEAGETAALLTKALVERRSCESYCLPGSPAAQ